jgi:shikimate dehydrogenase
MNMERWTRVERAVILFPFLEDDGMVITVGLIGDPVAHSVSPAMQNAAFAAHGLAEAYALWPTPAQLLAERVATLRIAGMRGANVTLPHKAAVLPLLDTLNAGAQAIGAVNTIVRAADGRLGGLNTDAPGFLRALQSAGYEVRDGAAVMLGAGGAARAVAFGLLQGGIRSLVVANRSVGRAAALLQDMRTVTDTMASTLALPLDDSTLEHYIVDADLLINATSVGLDGQSMPLGAEHVHADVFVVDLIYHTTPLLRAAAAHGARTQNGLEMLVQQGALAFEAWTGLDAPVAAMRTAAQHALENHV